MTDDEENPSSLLVQHRSKKNRQTKIQLVFDEQARKEYLKGFHKRKLERRERAQKELEDEIKNDLKNLKQKRREEMRKRHEALGLLDTVENHTRKRTINLKNHTIEIAEIDDRLISKTGLFMGNNQISEDQANEKEDNESISLKKSKSKAPLSKKMSILQNLKALNPGHNVKSRQRRSQKNGRIQTVSKKKRTRK